jgi:hypothetical protein
MRTGMDVLALGNFILLKPEQPEWPEAKGEGLENEDIVAPSRERHPAALLKDLRQLFADEFWPRAERLQEEKRVLVDSARHDAPSLWVESGESADLRNLFTLPEALRDERPSPDAFAEALTGPWRSRQAGDALRPVIARLIKAGLKYPVQADLGEAVSESVYVMF